MTVAAEGNFRVGAVWRLSELVPGQQQRWRVAAQTSGTDMIMGSRTDNSTVEFVAGGVGE
jgi:hypothetical protein